MDETQPAGGRRRTTAIIAAAGLACLAIAIPVSGAFGAGEDGSKGSTAAPQGYGPPPAYGGQARPDQRRPRSARRLPEAQGRKPGRREPGHRRPGHARGLRRAVGTKEPADIGGRPAPSPYWRSTPTVIVPIRPLRKLSALRRRRRTSEPEPACR